MLILILFTIAEIWEKPKCLIDLWIKSVWHIYTIEYYLAIKKNKVFANCCNLDGPESIMLGEKKNQMKTNTI